MKSVLGVAIVLVVSSAGLAVAADTYSADPVHSSVVFRAGHVGASHVWGRFNDPAGQFVLDVEDPTRCNFTVQIQVANIDTHNEKRDADLKSPMFFDARQYPVISFKSTSVKKGEGNVLQVTGDLLMHGTTRSITVPVELIGTGEFPPGIKRAGVEAAFSLKMSDYGIKGMPGAVSDEIKIIVALEGTRK
jgi:polyisoprenoid-binding protein YceI